jgi:hypothetical protein
VDEETIGLLESPEPIDPETSLDETDRTAPWPRLPVPVGTQRVLQIILGVFWIIDAALQYQPYMFGKQFVPTFIAGNAAGQPEPISWLITTAGHFISPDVGVWNFLFATVQVVIGFGLLFRRSVRPALVISFFWAFGVWFFGEGLGMVLTGSATALTGAPGSVLIYGLLGLMAWPRRSEEQCSTTTGIASSAAGQGIGGVLTPLSVWAGYWILAALLFLLPLNRTSGAISSNIAGMAPGTPEWYSHFLTSFGNAFASIGTQSSWVLTIGSLVIGLGPLLARRPQIFLLAGGVLSFVLWITGQGFLGGVFSGSGTDPNTGPLVIVLALAMVPIRIPDVASWTSPLTALVRRRPYAAVGGGIGLVCAIVLAATYPVAAQSPSNHSMPGMPGMSMGTMSGSGSQTASTATCTKGNSGSTRAGLDVANTPYMVMGEGNAGMNMNGADASAAAGLNSTKADWSYTGPALPTSEAEELLAQGKNGPNQIHMAVSGCAAEPTFSQEINATQFVQTTSEEVAQYSTPSAARAAGYVAVSPADYPIVYYVNPQVVTANLAAKRALSPYHVDGLVFAQTPLGNVVLAGAMYLLPSTVITPPMPYGALLQWHQRTRVCGPTSESAADPLQITGVRPCAPGSVQQATPYLTIVWQVPVAGGPLAIQPPDIQIVEAAIMTMT